MIECVLRLNLRLHVEGIQTGVYIRGHAGHGRQLRHAVAAGNGRHVRVCHMFLIVHLLLYICIAIYILLKHASFWIELVLLWLPLVCKNGALYLQDYKYCNIVMLRRIDGFIK